MIDIKTLEKMIELANTGGYTEIDKDIYFKGDTVTEIVNRFRFILLYNDIAYREINILPKNSEGDINIIAFVIDMDDYKHIDITKFAHYEIYIRGEFDSNVCVIFKEPIQTDQEQFLINLRNLSGDNDEVNNLIHSYLLFKDTHQYDVYAVQFNNGKLEKINETYLN